MEEILNIEDFTKEFASTIKDAENFFDSHFGLMSTEQVDDEEIIQNVKEVYKAIGVECPEIVISGSYTTGNTDFNSVNCKSGVIYDKVDYQVKSTFLRNRKCHPKYKYIMPYLDNYIKDRIGKSKFYSINQILYRDVNNLFHNSEMLNYCFTYNLWRDYLVKQIGMEVEDSPLINAIINLTRQCLIFVSKEDKCYVVRNLLSYSFNTNNQLHNENGPALQYSDGKKLYYLNGVAVQEWLVETRAEDIDPKKYGQIVNVEERREFIRKVGIERVWYDNAEIIDKDGDYELGRLNLGGSFTGIGLKMLNPSIGVWHIEFVGNECRTVEDAIQWRKAEDVRKIPIDKEKGADYYQQGDVLLVPKNCESLKPRPIILT